ncbi:MAG TPA: MATE family efflux transporter, partial [Treponema sp.]|nr:MATE family efflux transporter [Treponema sp.]
MEINNGEEKINRASLPMLSLTIPLLFENGFRILLSSVDTFMLSSWSQKAVAAAGMIGQYIFFIQILFNVICIGTSIVLSQYLGAKRNKEAEQVTQASVLMISLVALFIMLLIFFGAAPLLSLYSIEDDVRHMAWQYLVIFGGFGAFFMALNMLQGTVLR